ncbi:MAG: MBL fold metallo-hydrolase, partial [Clostridia bacterium]|nr:MBL fold metallo-hydrolase [Clostridia bacterium]
MANKKSNGKGKSTSQRSRSAAQRRAEKEAVAFAKAHKKGVITAVGIILIIIIAAVLIVYFCFPDLWKRAADAYLEYTKMYYNDSTDDDPAGTSAREPLNIEGGDQTEIIGSEFSIHFLEVGNKYAGDCTLIKCGDTEVLIDAGSRTNSAETINKYLSRYVTDNKIEYVIATHAHQDHIAAFVGTGSGNNKNGILYTYDIGTVIQFAGHNTSSGIYNSYVNAVTYAESNGAVAYTALQCWNNSDGAQRSYDLSAAGDGSLTLNILYNYYYEHETADENDYSVCALLTYTAADNTKSHYLFTGDLEGKGEEYLVAKNTLPEVELFKGGHHGSKTSSTEKLLSAIKPKRVAICCCAGATEYTTNHDNTFPTQAFIDRISKYTEEVYCTSLCIDYKGGKFGPMNGDIVFMYIDNKLKLWCSNNTTLLKDTEWFKA